MFLFVFGGNIFICFFNIRGSSTTTTSRGSTPASSEYNTSDSDSEVDFRQFSVQPVAPQANGSSSYRPVSLIFTRLSKIGMQHRDELVSHVLTQSNFRRLIFHIFMH